MFGRQRRLEVSSLLPTPNTGNLTLTACHHFSRGPKWFRFLIQNHFEVTTRYRSGGSEVSRVLIKDKPPGAESESESFLLIL